MFDNLLLNWKEKHLLLMIDLEDTGEGFLRCHSQLVTRVNQNLTHTRASITEKEIRN